MDLTTRDFDRLRKMVLAHSAIVLEPGKEYLVESRLAPIVRKEGLESFRDLAAQIDGPDSARICGLIVDAMTTNETSFFRDTHPWDTLREVMLPELIAARSSVKRLTIWCAASSSGQEPYSLAMMLHEHFPEVASTWTIKIIGTDLSPTMVSRSSSGRFSQLEVNRGLPIQLLMKYFAKVGNGVGDPRGPASHRRLPRGRSRRSDMRIGRFDRFRVGRTIHFKPSNATQTDVHTLDITRAVATLTATGS